MGLLSKNHFMGKVSLYGIEWENRIIVAINSDNSCDFVRGSEEDDYYLGKPYHPVTTRFWMNDDESKYNLQGAPLLCTLT